MRKVKQGEKVSRVTTVDGQVVTVVHVTEHSTEGKVVLNWKFDYTDVTEDEMLREMSRAHVIDMRPAWKKLGAGEAEKQADMTVNMREYLDRERRIAKSDGEKAGNLLDKMSPEERAAVIAKYAAM